MDNELLQIEREIAEAEDQAPPDESPAGPGSECGQVTQALKRIYIAGPMSGLPDFNYPAFHAAAAVLRAQGYHVEKPAENPPPVCGNWQSYMRMSLRQIAGCDCLSMLPGWCSSREARIEHGLALDLGLEVQDFGEGAGC